MGLIASAFRNLASPGGLAPLVVTPWQDGQAQLSDAKYETYAREGYQKNELVYAAIEELATSAAEPRMHALQGGKWTLKAPILDVLRRPNPFMDSFEFWATVIMHLSLAGNAYALKVRSGSTKVQDLWLMRPDRVSIVPDRQKYISRYEYDSGGGAKVPLAVEDVIHWKHRNPLDQFYGQPPLMAAAGRVDIDNYMKDFTKAFFKNAGVPAGILSVKSKVSPELRQEIKKRFSLEYGGLSGWHNLLVLDNTEATFTELTKNMGPSGLVVPSLDEINEARILMVFGVPPELIGARVGMQNSSYAQKRAARESFWDETLAPLYKMLAGPLNLRLIPDFLGTDEVQFDLTDVRALQEDQDKIHARWRSDLMSGGVTIEEFREATGRDPEIAAGVFLLPKNLAPVLATHLGAEEVGQEVQAQALNGAQIASMLEIIQLVASKTLDSEAAKAVIAVSFPTIDESTIDRMVDAAARSAVPETAD